MLSNISKLYHNYHFEKNTQLLEKKAIFSLHLICPGAGRANCHYQCLASRNQGNGSFAIYKTPTKPRGRCTWSPPLFLKILIFYLKIILTYTIS